MKLEKGFQLNKRKADEKDFINLKTTKNKNK